MQNNEQQSAPECWAVNGSVTEKRDITKILQLLTSHIFVYITVVARAHKTAPLRVSGILTKQY